MNRYIGPLILILFSLSLEASAEISAKVSSGQLYKTIASLPAPEHIDPKHVYALAQLVDKEVESLRYIMGATKINGTLFQVANAEPREVYFQAVNLYGKISRLHHNLTARSISDHDLPAVEQHIRPAHVWAVLSVALTQLNEIKKEYNITDQAQFPEIEENRKPSDVYQSLLLTIRQINQMLREEPYTHSDVYQEITTALYCLLNIYTTFPGLEMQRQPSLRPGKKSEDVFSELINTYQTVQDVMQLSGLKMLELSTVSAPDIKPGDIYELAVLITSELKFLHSKIAPEKTVHDAAYPGIKFPAHVLQRLTYLHSHLRIILQQIKEHPLI